MAAEAVALLKDFYATGNPKGVLDLGTQADMKLLSSVSILGKARLVLHKARDKSKWKEHSPKAMRACAA